MTAHHNPELSNPNTYPTLSYATLKELRQGYVPENEYTEHEINNIIAAGSRRLDESVDLETVDFVMTARMAFFEEHLGWGNKSHPMYDTFTAFSTSKPALIPLDTIIRTQTHLHEYTIKPAILHKQPKILTLSEETVRRKITNLIQYGIDPEVINKHPSIIVLSRENIRNKLTNLIGHGIKIKTINKDPGILKYSENNITSKIENLKQHAISLEAINKSPTILGFSEESINNKLAHLSSHGIDTTVVNQFPTILSYAEEHISKKINLLRSFNIDPIQAITLHPTLLGTNKETLRLKLTILLDNNIDVAALLHKKQGANVVIAPLETIIATFLDKDNIPTNNNIISKVRSKVRFLRKRHIKTRLERKQYILDTFPDATSAIGIRALEWAAHNKFTIQPQEHHTSLPLTD